MLASEHILIDTRTISTAENPGRYGVIAIPIKFDYCEEFKNGYSIIQQDKKWGAIDKDGKVIFEPKFEHQ